MIDTSNLNRELFYQIYLVDFGNFSYIKFETPLPLRDLLDIHFKVNPNHLGNTQDLKAEINRIISFLVKRHEMLDDYFSIKINVKSECIQAIPCLVDQHVPPMCRLPEFIYHLVTQVDWTSEKACFHSVGQQLAKFYSTTEPQSNDQYLAWSKLLKSTLYPLYKSFLYPSVELKNSLHCLTDIDSLYKVFERC